MFKNKIRKKYINFWSFFKITSSSNAIGTALL